VRPSGRQIRHVARSSFMNESRNLESVIYASQHARTRHDSTMKGSDQTAETYVTSPPDMHRAYTSAATRCTCSLPVYWRYICYDKSHKRETTCSVTNLQQVEITERELHPASKQGLQCRHYTMNIKARIVRVFSASSHGGRLRLSSTDYKKNGG